MTAEDILAIERPASIDQPGHQVAHVIQQINGAVHDDPQYAALRETAVAFYEQAVAASLADEPLDPPLNALRELISGGTVPPGYTPTVLPTEITALRDQLLGLVQPRTQVLLTGRYVLWDHHFELQTASGRHQLMSSNGGVWKTTNMLPPGSTVEIRGFLLEGPPPTGFASQIEVLEFAVLELPEYTEEDLDGNGLPDAWQQIFLGGLGTPLGGDTDGDGYLDPEELGAGSDPTDPADVPTTPPATPRDMRIEFVPGVGPSLVWDGSTVVDYQVWVTTGFFEFEPVPSPVSAEGPQRHHAPIDGTQPHEFYKVLINFPWLDN
jgi:hypothetical protein